jgi:hypothetical protein
LPRLSARIDAKPCFRMIQNSGRSGSCWPAVVHCTSPAHALACAVWPHNHAHLSTPNATPRHTVPTLSQAQSHPLSTYHTPTHTCTCARAQTRCRGDRYAALLGSARCVCVCVRAQVRRPGRHQGREAMWHRTRHTRRAFIPTLAFAALVLATCLGIQSLQWRCSTSLCDGVKLACTMLGAKWLTRGSQEEAPTHPTLHLVNTHPPTPSPLTAAMSCSLTPARTSALKRCSGQIRWHVCEEAALHV